MKAKSAIISTLGPQNDHMDIEDHVSAYNHDHSLSVSLIWWMVFLNGQIIVNNIIMLTATKRNSKNRR